MCAHVDRDRSAIGWATSDADGVAAAVREAAARVAGDRMTGARAASVVVGDGTGDDRPDGGPA